MSNPSNERSAESFFGDVISTYTRAQAIEDGVLIGVSPIAKAACFEWPVAMTAGAWADCVAWTETDSQTQVYQDQSGRLYDVIFMVFQAICLSTEAGDRLLFRLYRVPRDGQTMEAELTTLKLIVGPGDNSEPVITILTVWMADGLNTKDSVSERAWPNASTIPLSGVYCSFCADLVPNR